MAFELKRTRHSTDVFLCGPVELHVTAARPHIRSLVAETLRLYNAPWDTPHLKVQVNIEEGDSSGDPSTHTSSARQHPRYSRAAGSGTPAQGNFLLTARLRVDVTPAGLYATALSGLCGVYVAEEAQWSILVPLPDARGGVLADLEDLLGLVLTTAWREAGWVPVHAGAVMKGDCCALVCAPGGGGKSTFTASLLRRDWRTLGDDKLLLQLDSNGRPQLRALVHSLNLHPEVQRWFPEVGDLSCLPVYSTWTNKRRVRIEELWRGQTLTHSMPTHLIQLTRVEHPFSLRIASLDNSEIMEVLLRQTVIPQARALAGTILAAIVATARQLRGLRVELGMNAYTRPDALVELERMLENA